MAADVEAIADKAAKEAHQGAALLVIQNTWDRIEFCITAPAKTETETPLVKMTEEDLEVIRECLGGYSIDIEWRACPLLLG